MPYSSKVASKQTLINRIDARENGGPNKAGFPYQVGRDSWTSIFLNYPSHPLRVWNTGGYKARGPIPSVGMIYSAR